MNPTIGSGMQQARDSQRICPQGWSRGSSGNGANGGANRRGGAKPRGRNMVRIRQIRTRSHGGDIETGVDAREHVDGGVEWHGRAGGGQGCPPGDSDRTNPRRGDRETDRGTACCSEGERRPGRLGLESASRDVDQRTAVQSETLEGHRATGKTEEGAGKANDPLRRQRRRPHANRKKRLYAAALKIPPTP
jgi:hypothetical protein